MSTLCENVLITDMTFSDCPAIETTVNNTAVLDIDILLLGETGTGKDTLAQRIHQLSRRKGNFVAVNCAAIPETLAESQLFGVNSGAYTGAMQSRAGFVEAAHLGTLYLDEIDSMPLSLQAKLLRVLESRGVERLGSTRFIPVDMRVIASAQHALHEMVEQGTFRRDLYFRLNVVNIHLPALRDRRERIIPLFLDMIEQEADHFRLAAPSPPQQAVIATTAVPPVEGQRARTALDGQAIRVGPAAVIHRGDQPT